MEVKTKLDDLETQNTFQLLQETRQELHTKSSQMSEIENQLRGYKESLNEKKEAEAYFEEAYSRSKQESISKQAKVESMEIETLKLNERNVKLEATVDHLREQLDKITHSALKEKDYEIT